MASLFKQKYFLTIIVKYKKKLKAANKVENIEKS